MAYSYKVQEVLELFEPKDEDLFEISKKIRQQIELGLEKGAAESPIAMLPSYVPELPDGTEVGKFLSIDLSGKNLRIMLLILKGRDGEPEQIVDNYCIPNPVMVGSGEQLFTFIVNCLLKFLRANDLLQSDLSIGFVFSFPCELHSIRSARLLWWTKGFDIKDCLQKDVVSLLEQALGLGMQSKVTVKAVMNDTVGQLISASYKYGSKCTMGVVIGYGCNSAYLEKAENVKTLDMKKVRYDEFKTMVMVTEWEEFGQNGEFETMLTEWDREVDEHSVHKGKQMLDKLTGALYMGELVRRVLLKLTMDGLIFSGRLCDKLETPDTFPTKYISEILSDTDGNFKACRRICDELDIPSHCANDYEAMHDLCSNVSERSAGIVAAAISALLSHMKQKEIQIGVGGALVQFHPTYLHLLTDKLKLLAPKDIEWEIVRADEGSAKGAAIVAAVAERLFL
uniref:Phosphotransferase n=1 Tax=Syphacia muris TaxID=451379 RepID=A0A158R513_9BILA